MKPLVSRKGHVWRHEICCSLAMIPRYTRPTLRTFRQLIVIFRHQQHFSQNKKIVEQRALENQFFEFIISTDSKFFSEGIENLKNFGRHVLKLVKVILLIKTNIFFSFFNRNRAFISGQPNIKLTIVMVNTWFSRNKSFRYV